jgi:hypothetical protein
MTSSQKSIRHPSVLLGEVLRMHAMKVLVFVVITGALAAAALFTFVPSTRPDPVKGVFRKLNGFTPATTPNDCLDKFKKAIEKRDYETAALYTTGEYTEFLLKTSKGAQKLGQAVDDLVYNLDKYGVRSDKAKLVLHRIEPFPRSYKVNDVKSDGNKAVAQLSFEEELLQLKIDTHLSDWRVDTNMIYSLLPDVPVNVVSWVMNVELVNEKGSWKINFPVTTRLRRSSEALKDNATNYANALNQVKFEVKNDPGSKEQFERRLKTALEESR